MSDPVTTAIVVKAAEIVAKEGYDDGLKPPLQEAGKALALPLQTLNTALRPVRSMLLAANLVFDRLDQAIAEKLKDIPEEKILEPPLNVAGPLLLGYAFAEGEPTLQELYEQLLASAMLTDTQAAVHPSFVDVLRQLSPDEARIIGRLDEQQQRMHPVVKIVHLAAHNGTVGEIEIGLVWAFYDDHDLKHPEFNGTYLENLVRLGILKIDFRGAVLGADYSKLEEEGTQHSAKSAKEGTGVRLIRGYVEITRFGMHFMQACIHSLAGWTAR